MANDKQLLRLTTEGQLDDIRVISATLPDHQVEAMVRAQTFAHALDQHGRVIELSFNMEVDDLIVDAITAAPLRHDYEVGYWDEARGLAGAQVGRATRLGEVITGFVGADGRNYDGISRCEPFDAIHHAELLGVAIHGKYREFNNDQRALTKQLESDCGLTHTLAVTLVDELSRYGAQHLALREIDVNAGQNDRQCAAEQAIEARVADLVSTVPGLGGVNFLGDPRGETIVLTFDSGARNSPTGGWKVPVNPRDSTLLMGKQFWDEYAQAVPEARWIVLSIEETGNAAFIDVGREHEVARIIADAAEKVRNAPSSHDIDLVLADLNGNRVGKLYTTDVEPTGPMEPATVRLVIDDADHALSRPDHHENLAQLLELVSTSVEAGRRSFTMSTVIPGADISSSARFEFSDLPTAEHEGRIFMEVALRGNIYMADGIEEGEYRYVIPKDDFEIGYHQDYGDVWLVNAKGDIAPGYEDTQSVRENCMRELKADERRALTDVIERRVSFEDHERSLGNEDYLDESPEI